MTKKVIGLIIVVYGMLLLLSNLDIIEIVNIWGYVWTMALIFIGIIGMVEKKGFDVFFSAMILFGCLHLLRVIGLIEIGLINVILWPVLIMGIGLALIINFNVTKSKNIGKKYIAFFSGVEEKVEDNNYEGNELFCMFGGIKIDLRKAKFKNNKAYLDVFCAFGGTEIIVPEDVKVITKGLPIFGGCENKTRSNEKATNELTINYNVLFGGIEIKN